MAIRHVDEFVDQFKEGIHILHGNTATMWLSWITATQLSPDELIHLHYTKQKTQIVHEKYTHSCRRGITLHSFYFTFIESLILKPYNR